jgi:XFP N-terminal domain
LNTCPLFSCQSGVGYVAYKHYWEVVDRETAGAVLGHPPLNPARDRVVLPILHLNGYKIANPCLPSRYVRF